MSRRSIYLDYNATTPLDPEVRDAMLPFLGTKFGNASSLHQRGREARSALDEFRERVSAVWDCKAREVVFTSGGTESANLAVLGAARALRIRGNHLIVSAIEHHAVLRCAEFLRANEGFDVDYLPVGPEGCVLLPELRRLTKATTVLVSVMAANNETGTTQPATEIGEFCRERGIVFHTDAVQWFGKEPFESIHQFGAHLVSSCAHKFHGPKGAGALFVESPLQLRPVLLGGSQELDRRAGTENLAAIAGFVKATELFVRRPVFDPQRMRDLESRLRSLLRPVSGLITWGDQVHRLPNTLAISLEGCDSIGLVAALDLEGIQVSAGAACSSGSLEPSHVLLAMGASKEQSASLVRFSLGRETSEAEVEETVECLVKVVKKIRKESQ